MEEAEHEGGGHRPFIIKFDGKTLQSGALLQDKNLPMFY